MRRNNLIAFGNPTCIAKGFDALIVNDLWRKRRGDLAGVNAITINIDLNVSVPCGNQSAHISAVNLRFNIAIIFTCSIENDVIAGRFSLLKKRNCSRYQRDPERKHNQKKQKPT